MIPLEQKMRYEIKIWYIFTVVLDISLLKKVSDPKQRFEISAGSHKFQRGQNTRGVHRIRRNAMIVTIVFFSG
jgi:hypothetical protein